MMILKLYTSSKSVLLVLICLLGINGCINTNDINIRSISKEETILDELNYNQNILLEKVEEALKTDAILSAIDAIDNIQLEQERNIILLKGSVSDESTLTRIKYIVMKIDGVNEINTDQLEIESYKIKPSFPSAPGGLGASSPQD